MSSPYLEPPRRSLVEVLRERAAKLLPARKKPGPAAAAATLPPPAEQFDPREMIPPLSNDIAIEGVALVLLRAVIAVEGAAAGRAAILDAYAECLTAARGERTRPDLLLH
jgi:hypothetical protein